MATWEIRIRRHVVQMRGQNKRTVGSYGVFHDGVAVPDEERDGVLWHLSGTTAEPKGPSQNDHPATEENPSRILPRRYPLKTSGGETYLTNHYRPDELIENGMPGIELLDTGARADIIIHPGKNAFLSSIGCINLCTSLPDANEDIDYPGSRRRVIALIEDMKRFLGDAFPLDDDIPIPDAWAVIEGEP